MTTCPWVWLDGDFVAAENARISVFDRGFLFAHAAYEVTAVYAGRMIDLDAHLARLARTLAAIALPTPKADLAALHHAIIARNRLEEGLIYLQVTGGDDGTRSFAGPAQITPRLVMFAQQKKLLGTSARTGIAAITLPDTRWARRDLKTTQLLSQARAYRTAEASGATTALMYEHGHVTEAASSNVWIVTACGQIVTRDTSPAILTGVTRAAVLEATRGNVYQRSFSLTELSQAKEVFTTSTGAMVLPVVTIDGKAVGDGKPGPVTRRLQRAYCARIGMAPADISHALG